MTSMLIAAIVATFALQASAPAATQTSPATLADLPIEEATAPRCGIVFATLEGWQKNEDPRGEEWPDIAAAGGREFFVVAMARLMDRQQLDRQDIQRIVQAEVARHAEDDGASVSAMLPACLSLLPASGLRGE